MNQLIEVALYSPDEWDTFQISLALVPGGHSAHLICMSLSLIIPSLKFLWNAYRPLIGMGDTAEQDKLRCNLQYHLANPQPALLVEKNIHADQSHFKSMMSISGNIYSCQFHHIAFL